MGAMTSQITRLTIGYSTVHSGADQRKHQSSTSLAFVWGIHRWPVNSPHKWPAMPKMLPFDDVIVGLIQWRKQVFAVVLEIILQCIPRNMHTAQAFLRFVLAWYRLHYNAVIMSAMVAQITSLTIVYSTFHSGTDQRKHQWSPSLAYQILPNVSLSELSPNMFLKHSMLYLWFIISNT